MQNSINKNTQELDNEEKCSTISDDKPDEREEKKRTNFSSLERFFWITILMFFFIFSIIFFMAFINTKKVNSASTAEQPRTILDNYVDKYFPSDKLKQNLLKEQEKINEHLKQEIDLLNEIINREVENLFSVMEYRIDSYLDYHYSIKGEYTELYAMASNKISRVLEEKLIGNDFNYKLQEASNIINTQYKERIEEHLSFLEKVAFKGVDINLEINQQTKQQLQAEIIKNQMLQEGKFTLIVTGMLAKKISVAITGKIAAKATGKIAAKSALKLGSKAASTTAAGAIGLICGPAAIVCAPVLATLTWFGTDAIIITADEHLNRSAFKAQIYNMINNQKSKLKNSFQQTYAQALETMSHSTQAKIAMTKVHEKREVRVSN